MNHTHHYSYWHAHEHYHREVGPDGNSEIGHASGHHHFYANTHEHGDQSNKTPHSHKEKQYHPTNDTNGPYHHHAVADHELEEEKK